MSDSQYCRWRRFGRVAALLSLSGWLIPVSPQAPGPPRSQAQPVIFSVFPQIAIGGGWTGDLFVNNQGNSTAFNIELSFFRSDGVPLVLETDQGTLSFFAFSLAEGATHAFRLNSPNLASGYAVLRAPAQDSIRASLSMSLELGGQVTSSLGVSQQFTRNSYSFPAEVDTMRGVDTGMALALPEFASGSTQTVVVSLIDPDGTLLDFATVELDSGHHQAKFLSEFFPGLDNFRGSVNAACASRFGIIALRSDRNSFGAVSVHPGPIAAPFLVASDATGEGEPNDTQGSSQALVLPARIAGDFDAPGDNDVFSFMGQAGDVLTALTNTHGGPSNADTVLILEMPGGQQITSNDQNGLINDDDSFLQAVLPASGTYFLRVLDFFTRGGAGFDYELHAQILNGGQTGPPPTLTSALPGSSLQGTTVKMKLRGTNLANIQAVNISPPSGLMIDEIVAESDEADVTITIASDAQPGQRQISVTTPAGTSNSQAWTIVARPNGPNVAPVISNLSVGNPSISGNRATISFSFHFEDPDGDILYSGNFDTSAQILFNAMSCSSSTSGTLVNRPGTTSGNFNFNLIIQGFVQNAKEVTLRLKDAAGNVSNELKFTPSVWRCG